jgi:hypothetical protein
MSHSQRLTTTFIHALAIGADATDRKSSNNVKRHTDRHPNPKLVGADCQYLCPECGERVTAQRIFEVTDRVCWSYRCEDCGRCYGKPTYRGDLEYIGPIGIWDLGLQAWPNRRRP